MYNVRLLAGAYKDLNASVDWYDSRQQGLGKMFLKQVLRTLSHIEKNPYLYPLKFAEEFRFAKVNKFPYFIVFEVIDHVVAVNAIFHTSRNPEKFE